MLNKKVLVAAVAGVLFAGSAAATDFTTAGGQAAINATAGKFAKEIKTTASVATATQFTGAGVSLKWAQGYNFSPGEVRYVRIETSPNVVFTGGVPAAAGGVGTLTPGVINGTNTNVITFSVTAGAAAASGHTWTLPATVKATSIANATVSISLYDQPSQAQAGGDTGKIAGASYSGTYMTFADSLKWIGTPNTLTADVNAAPSYTNFTPVQPAAPGSILNTGFGLDVTGTLKADSAAIAVADLLDANSVVHISGDYSFIASSGAAPFNGAAMGRVGAFGATAGDLDADYAEFDLNAGIVGNVTLLKLITPTWNPVIAESTYTAKLLGEAATPATYNVPVLADTTVGTIVRNGTTLQAPFVQIPGGWKSRLVLTNTSSVDRPYTISLMQVNGEAVTPGTLTGTIPAKGTKAIDDLSTVFSGNARATLNVDIAAPRTAVQGLYQIVNPDKGSISNHVLVAPGTN